MRSSSTDRPLLLVLAFCALSRVLSGGAAHYGWDFGALPSTSGANSRSSRASGTAEERQRKPQRLGRSCFRFQMALVLWSGFRPAALARRRTVLAAQVAPRADPSGSGYLRIEPRAMVCGTGVLGDVLAVGGVRGVSALCMVLL